MSERAHPTHLLFVGPKLLTAGNLLTVALAFKELQPSAQPALIFEADSGRQIDVDVRGSIAVLEERYGNPDDGAVDENPAEKPRGRGRPRLGVVGREVTLLPRHWEWLDQQRGGASAALRRLVDQARRSNQQADVVRQSQDRANRFLAAMAGNLPGFEEATRALFAGDEGRFVAETRQWPKDIRRYALEFARDALTAA